MRKNILFLHLTILTLALSFCGGGGDSLKGVVQNFKVNSANDNLTIDANDPSTDDDVSLGRAFTGPEPTVPTSVGPGGASDDDGDGILDGQDNIPDRCTKMVVTANGVSSARINLNDDELYSPNDFHNSDFSKSTVVNLRENDNFLSIKLTGSPGDQLNIRFYDCTENPSELVYEVTVTRIKGNPNLN